ncbi:aspartic peptidase domain-containing protein [Gigaspora rosea]|uniref:Aspartic peptidase domain-containing protein n=1 Tax=Gigaspora rosea TaxID=44941 RepID=A0A397VNY5_9GLOM|nr:aspartic peptidase domain-containing protein [Gigaspora rosea]
MTILFKLHIRQSKLYHFLLIIFTIFWSYIVNAQINNDVAIDDIDQNWKRGNLSNTTLINATVTASITPPIVTPITAPLKINLTFEQSLMHDFCMNPSGTACGNRTTNFFNASLSSTITGDYQEFTTKFIDGSELEGVLTNDTIIINTQTLEQMTFGLPIVVKRGNIVNIPDTITGKIGLMPYQNNPIVGIALSMSNEKGGSNENNVTYQLLPQPMEANQQFTVNVTNIYINNKPINLSGLIWFDSGIQNIQLDDNSASIIINNLPGGNYSNGIGTTNCNISTTFDLSFEIANKKWRLPSSVISKNGINGTNKCGSIITSGAKDIGSWIFGSAFLTNYYIVFDQAKSQFGIATRNDINYGPDAPVIPEAEAAHIIQNIIISPNPVTAASTAEFTISLSTANFTFRSDTFMKIDVMANIEYYGFNSTLFCNNPDNSDCPKNDINKTLTLSIKNGGLKFDIAADCLEADVGIPTSVT